MFIHCETTWAHLAQLIGYFPFARLIREQWKMAFKNRVYMPVLVCIHSLILSLSLALSLSLSTYPCYLYSLLFFFATMHFCSVQICQVQL